jgi:murein DD-endopeptidase MepM/ murein hydrolase activator NlpD
LKQPFIAPLEIPLVLSGNYGEIRSGHFHAGIDLKTQQVTGKRVLASREGYIARIAVQSGGYGNALYLAHPGGYMTVYGHLQEFMPDVQDYIRENQYRMKSFEVNLFPEPGMFRYSQGDLIGYSGNSGSSGGPHLHFEIRDLNTSIPLNVLNFNMPVSDNIAPRILWLAAYPQGPESLVDGSNRKKIFQVLMRDGYYT